MRSCASRWQWAAGGSLSSAASKFLWLYSVWSGEKTAAQSVSVFILHVFFYSVPADWKMVCFVSAVKCFFFFFWFFCCKQHWRGGIIISVTTQRFVQWNNSHPCRRKKLFLCTSVKKSQCWCLHPNICQFRENFPTRQPFFFVSSEYSLLAKASAWEAFDPR